MVRIDDTHIAEEQFHAGGKPKDGTAGRYDEEEEEEEDNVFVIEYSNPEEEGESYKFTMSVDRSLPAKKPVIRHPAAQGNARTSFPVTPGPPPHAARQKRKLAGEEEAVLSSKSVPEMNSGAEKRLICSLCPPPGKFFKRGSGLAIHVKQVHLMVEKKTFFCTTCQQRVRTQIELDTHTKRHANQDAVFTCHLCSADGEPGFQGSRWGLKRHLQKEHPGVVPHCHICNKGFRLLVSYLADQFRHVGRTPYYCARCQIYEMTERGLSVHIRNHDKKTPRQQAPAATNDNSATDDSDF